MWKVDVLNALVQSIETLPDRLAQSFERQRSGPAAAGSPAAPGGDPTAERRRLLLTAENIRQLVLVNLNLRTLNIRLRESTQALSGLTRAAHELSRVFQSMTRDANDTGRDRSPVQAGQQPAHDPGRARPPLPQTPQVPRGTATGALPPLPATPFHGPQAPTQPAQSGPGFLTLFGTHALARYMVRGPRVSGQFPPPPPPPAGPSAPAVRPPPTPTSSPETSAQQPAPEPRPSESIPPPPRIAIRNIASQQGRIRLGELAPLSAVLPRVAEPPIRRRGAMGHAGGLSLEGLTGGAVGGGSDYPFAAGARIPEPVSGDILRQSTEMLRELMERFGAANQQLQETLGVLHTRFPERVPEAQIPRTGVMAPGSEPAKDTPEAADKLSDVVSRLADVVSSLQQRVPVLVGGGGGFGGGGGSGQPPTTTGPSAPGSPPIDRSYLQRLLDSAPKPSAGTRAAFLKRMDLRRMLGLPVRPRDVEALSGLVDTGHPLQEGVLSRAVGGVGRHVFNKEMVDALRHLWGVGGAARQPDLIKDVFARLIGANRGRTAVTADMMRDLALSGAEPSGPFDFRALYKRFKGGDPPSRKLLMQMGQAFGLGGMIPTDWFPRGKKLPGDPSAPGFMGPVLPPLTGDPSAPGFIGPPVPPPARIVKLMDELRDRLGKGNTVSKAFLAQVRGALRGKAGSEELFKLLEGMSGQKLTPEVAAQIAKVGGFSLPGQSFAGGGHEPMGLLGLILQGLGGKMMLPMRTAMPGGFGGNILGTLGRGLFYGSAAAVRGIGNVGATAFASVYNRVRGAGGVLAGTMPPAPTWPGGAAATAASGGLWMVAAAAAAVGYAFTKLPHDISRGARGQLESYRDLAGIHGGMAATFIASDIAALKRDRDYASRILGSTRVLAAATNDLDDKLLESRVLWGNASNLFWSGLSGLGSGLAEGFSPVARTINDVIGGEDASTLANRFLYRYGRAGMAAFRYGPGPHSGFLGAYDFFFGPDGDPLKDLPRETPWSRYLADVARGPLRPARPMAPP